MRSTSPQLDGRKAQAFAAKMVGIMNGASLALMASLGHRAGLFDAMAKLPASSSQTIADATQLNERYVREWLGAMVTGGIVEYDAAARTYQLPPEHAASLTRAAGPKNVANALQFIPLFGAVEDAVLESFHHGGGVPYSEFERFHLVMAEMSNETVCTALLDVTLPMIDGLVARLERGVRVLDVGCGSGHALHLLAEHFPQSRFTGYDLSADAIASARGHARKAGLGNVEFHAQDVTQLPDGERFDFITAFDAIHDQAKPARVLENIATALADDGVFLMQDIAASSHLENNKDLAFGPWLYTASTMHCMTVSLALGGDGLGTVWGKELALEMLAAAGFANVDVRQIDDDVFNYYYICRK